MKRSAEDIERIAELEAERDALAAHLSRYETEARRFQTYTAYTSSDDFVRWHNDTPATSLARLKAECRADLLRGLLLNHSEFLHPEAGAIVELMDGLEKALRRQAEEAS